MNSDRRLTLKGVRATLISLAIAAVCIRIVWWAVEPLVPYIIGGAILLTIIGIALSRLSRL